MGKNLRRTNLKPCTERNSIQNGRKKVYAGYLQIKFWNILTVLRAFSKRKELKLSARVQRKIMSIRHSEVGKGKLSKARE